MSALDDVLCCRGVAEAVAADRGDTTLDAARAELAELRRCAEEIGRQRRAQLEADVEFAASAVDREAERLAERAAVVAWLRAEAAQRAHKGQVWRLGEIEALEFAADAIGRGEHVEDGDE